MKTELLKHALRDGREAVEYQIQPGEMMDGQVLKACKDGRVLGLLPMGAIYEDGHNYMYAYTDKRDTLAKRLEETATQKLILSVFESITDTLIRMEEQGINLAYAVLNEEYIYMDEETGKARLICMPGRNARMNEGGVQGFFRNILANAIYLNSEDGDYVAKLLSALNKEFALQSFLRQIHGLMMDAGIEIVEEILPEPVTPAPVVPETPMAEPIIPEAVVPEAPVAEPIIPEVPVSETPVAEPIIPEAVVPEAIAAEPIIPEVLVPETPAAEPIIPEVVVPETPATEPIIPEVLVPETPVAEPIIPEAVVPEAPVAEPIIPEVLVPETPVAEPIIPEAVVPETPAAEPLPAKSQTDVSFPAEDDIEFEPMPEEMNAKIQRMNMQSVPQNVSAAPAASIPQSQPIQPGVSNPQSQPVKPMPQIIPQDATFQQEQKRPNPHLVRLKTGENVLLPEEKLVIGKSQTGVDYVIQDNAAISRIHCTIMKRNGAYYVRDEKSTNGTFVNGEQVPSETERLLLNNCRLTLGDEEFLYSLW